MKKNTITGLPEFTQEDLDSYPALSGQNTLLSLQHANKLLSEELKDLTPKADETLAVNFVREFVKWTKIDDVRAALTYTELVKLANKALKIV